MASTTLGVKVDDLLRSRLKDAATRLERTPHWLIKQAIFAYLETYRARPVAARTVGRDTARPSWATAPPVESDEDGASHPFLDFAQNVQPQSVLRAAITAAYRRPEPECVPFLVGQARLPASIASDAQALATKLVETLRAKSNGRRRRRADPRVFAVEPGRRRADVPRRSAAAHSRSRHARRADPRQDQQGRLALARGPGAVAVRQRRDVGPDDHRQAGDDEQRNGPVVGADAPDRQAAASR